VVVDEVVATIIGVVVEVVDVVVIAEDVVVVFEEREFYNLKIIYSGKMTKQYEISFCVNQLPTELLRI